MTLYEFLNNEFFIAALFLYVAIYGMANGARSTAIRVSVWFSKDTKFVQNFWFRIAESIWYLSIAYLIIR